METHGSKCSWTIIIVDKLRKLTSASKIRKSDSEPRGKFVRAPIVFLAASSFSFTTYCMPYHPYCKFSGGGVFLRILGFTWNLYHSDNSFGILINFTNLALPCTVHFFSNPLRALLYKLVLFNIQRSKVKFESNIHSRTWNVILFSHYPILFYVPATYFFVVNHREEVFW